MSHSDAVANPDRVKDERNAARVANGLRDVFRNRFQMDVARNNIDATADNRDERTLEIFFGNAASSQKTAMGRAANAFFN